MPLSDVRLVEPLSGEYIRAMQRYFRSKSAMFDACDELFLHIGFSLDATRSLKPQDLVELAIEDVQFQTQEETMAHVSLYVAFHNSVVRFLELLEHLPDERAVLTHIDALARAMVEIEDPMQLCDAMTTGCEEVARLAAALVGVRFELSSESVKAFEAAANDALAAKLYKDLLESVQFLQSSDPSEAQCADILRLGLFAAMAFYRLKKERQFA